MRLRLDIDKETHDRLLQVSLLEKRPIHWQAEVLLRCALGLPFPPKSLEALAPSDRSKAVSAEVR